MSHDHRTTTRRNVRRRATVAAAAWSLAGLVLVACGESSSVDNGEESQVSVSSVPATQPETTPAETTPVTEPPTTPATEPATTPETAPPTTAAPVEPPALLTAIDGAGDAVVIEAGVPTVVYDGTDPDDAAPEEGESVSIDGVAVAPDGRVIVSLCCEPVPGSLLAVDRATGIEEYIGFGHLATFTAAGSMVWTAYGPVNVGGVDTSVVAELAVFEPTDGNVIDLAVVPSEAGETVLVLVAGADGTTLHRFPAAGGDMQLSAPVSAATWLDPEPPVLVGYDTEAFYVLDRTGDRLLAFDAATLEPLATPAVLTTWLGGWITPERTLYITDARALVVDGGDPIPGEYLWVR
jgi:hypothetical protein